MVKSKTKKSIKNNKITQEWDSVYILKIVLFIILGSQWLFIVNGSEPGQLPIPYGFCLGLVFAMHDHFKIDRKIEIAVLLVAMFVGFWLPMGLTIVR